MCYFEQTIWACGAWRWRNFRERCYKEHRIGETCELKLVYSPNRKGNARKVCDQISTKNRRIKKMMADIERWQREGNRTASIERADTDIAELKNVALRLLARHNEGPVGSGWRRS
ncbi:hypothetical protein K469DRAFT_710372 [Zopfia rhizophila CBS 207.26]|uniref:Uncharacterized protein n=1 Tax=Zopfia rhizophila CBS 207.26 TaxID=1314779 RepID=A0A6A6DWD5_9PEZI|nr:hypothetical protein K469DRAFT_710372 [Zopfia rhizophila CBS 207.26]